MMEKGTDEMNQQNLDQEPTETQQTAHSSQPAVTQPDPSSYQAPEDPQETENFMELYEESLKTIQEGDVVTGQIVHIDKEYVLVDIGYKSEGQIPISEFLD